MRKIKCGCAGGDLPSHRRRSCDEDGLNLNFHYGHDEEYFNLHLVEMKRILNSCLIYNGDWLKHLSNDDDDRGLLLSISVRGFVACVMVYQLTYN